ncbi:MAG: glutamine--fructose-6-phosphate transaminase (isomerizing) [Candidatus Paceibacterota bacterium]|jgi:glucosamine--fructose-6-phosphate aminotransferase (isomerizing)
MCGIVGYIGKKEAYPILIKGLKRLEYRGYDSSGVGIINNDQLFVYKQKGKIENLEKYVKEKPKNGNIGIGHTRWATHGEPNNENAHPHFSESKNLILVHNGIIENYLPIKKELQKKGHVFLSETDTEVLAHLIEDIQDNEKVNLTEAVRLSLNQIIGAYAIVVLSKNDPDKLIVARKSSPLIIGVGKDEFYVASDATPIIEYTKKVIYLNDEEMAVISRTGKIKITTIKNIKKTPYIHKLELSIEEIEKGGFESFMLKEINEQPKSVLDSMRGRFNTKKNLVKLGGIENYEKTLAKVDRIVILGCGTSWHAGLIGKYLFEEFARIKTEVEYASEFRYRNPVLDKKDIAIAISQSGETADTLAAVKLVKENGIKVLGICNVVGSSITRATDGGSYTHAGPEIGVASTKAFTAQVVVLTLMALRIGILKRMVKNSQLKKLLLELEQVPEKISEILKLNDKIKKIAEIYKNSTNAIYLGRGYNFPVALEGALKLKEISYIHAEGYPAAEMKHGPIALIDENMPVIVLALSGLNFEKVINNIQEIKARKAKVILITNNAKIISPKLYDHLIEIPEIDESLSPLISVIPLQLLAYHIARFRDCNVDQPRNLAKSVTVE